jgi:hypothetical protein
MTGLYTPSIISYFYIYIILMDKSIRLSNINIFKEVLQMDDYNIFEELNSKENEIQRLKADSIQAGFMENRFPNYTFPFQPQFTPYNPAVTLLYDRILEKVTGTELTILCRTRYNSPKAQILEYVRILERLVEEGVFDAPEVPQYPNYTTPWGAFGATGVAPTETKTEETEKVKADDEAKAEETKTETDNYKNLEGALGALMKICDETGISIITAIKKLVDKEYK